MRARLTTAVLLVLAFAAGATAWRVDDARQDLGAPSISEPNELEVLRQERRDMERELPVRLSGRILAMQGYDAGVAHH